MPGTITAIPRSRRLFSPAAAAVLPASAGPRTTSRWDPASHHAAPGSGSCRARSIPASKRTSTTSTASKLEETVENCTPGRKVICYIDVGSWEPYRPDAAEFPGSVRGNPYEGFEEERWLDISRFKLFQKPLEKRFKMCARKGFDAVEPDNIAGWEKQHRLKITRADQLKYNRWVARQVHKRGMAVALKNDGRQTKELLGSFDFAIVEECFQYEECDLYSPFIEAGKAVFETEYELEPSEYCEQAKELDFSSIRKSLDCSPSPGGRA